MHGWGYNTFNYIIIAQSATNNMWFIGGKRGEEKAKTWECNIRFFVNVLCTLSVVVIVLDYGMDIQQLEIARSF